MYNLAIPQTVHIELYKWPIIILLLTAKTDGKGGDFLFGNNSRGFGDCRNAQNQFEF